MSWIPRQRSRRVALLFGVGLLGLVWTPAVGFANESHHDFAKHALWSLLYHQKDMNLSGDQVKKITAIGFTYGKAQVKAEAEVKLAKLEALALKMDESSELGAIEAALQKQERAETVLHLEGVKAIRAAMGVLTPEQRDTWKHHMMKLGKKRAHESEGCGEK